MKSIALTLAVLLGTLSFAAQATSGSTSDQTTDTPPVENASAQEGSTGDSSTNPENPETQEQAK